MFSMDIKNHEIPSKNTLWETFNYDYATMSRNSFCKFLNYYNVAIDKDEPNIEMNNNQVIPKTFNANRQCEWQAMA